MTLDLIVPHYKEPWETCKYLFDTLATQRGINFDDIRVIVVNDGDCFLSDDCFTGYPYKVEYLKKQHGGVSAARNYGLDHSSADYVMFCDIDDGFLSNYGLYLVFAAMHEGFDMLVSSFVEESFSNDEKHVPLILPRDDDMTFIHGKVYRRQFLVENDLRFGDELTIHEDGYFNLVTYTVAKANGSVKKIRTPFYLWRWNDSSVVRSNRSDFVLKTYSHLMAARIKTCEEMKRRGFDEEYRVSVCMTVLNSYYDFQKGSFQTAANAKYCRAAEKEFKAFWDKFKDVFNNSTNDKIAEIGEAARANARKTGFLFERQDLKSWLKHIEYEVK